MSKWHWSSMALEGLERLDETSEDFIRHGGLSGHFQASRPLYACVMILCARLECYILSFLSRRAPAPRGTTWNPPQLPPLFDDVFMYCQATSDSRTVPVCPKTVDSTIILSLFETYLFEVLFP